MIVMPTIILFYKRVTTQACEMQNVEYRHAQ